MTVQRSPDVVSFSAQTALKKFKVVRTGASANQVAHNTSSTTPSVGIVYDTASASDAVAVAVGGVAKAMVGRAVSKDNWLTVDSTARVVHCTTSNQDVVGLALTTQATVGGLVEVLITQHNY